MNAEASPAAVGGIALPALHEACHFRPGEVAASPPGREDLASQAEEFLRGTPLHFAAASPAPAAAEGVAALLAAGADPEAGDADGAPPLFWAARWGGIDAVIELMGAGGLPGREDGRGRSVFHWWAMGEEENGQDIENFLLDSAAPLDRSDHGGRMPAHWAAALGARMERLLAAAPEVAEQKDSAGFTPMFHAAGAGISIRAVRPLIKAGADPDRRAGELTPLDFAPDPDVWLRATGTPPAGEDPAPSP